MNFRVFQKELWLPVTFVLLLNLSANILGLYKYSYDAYTHIFFADHYMKDWLNLWENRWYGGFPVTSYPPLVHQLIALLGYMVGVEFSYQIMSITSAVMLVLSIYKASQIFLDKDEAKYVAVVSSLLPSMYLTLYVYGQLPTIFAASFTFLAAYTFHNYLLSGGRKDLAYTSLLSVLVASSHHFTLVFFFPIVMLLTFLMSNLKAKISLKYALKRLIIASLVSIFLILVIMEPFFEFVIKAPFQTEIPHATRGNIFAIISHSLLFFWGVYGFTIALVPVGFLIVTRRRELAPLFTVFILLFILGLGGITPIPKLLLGNLWYILTYDRFAVWASLLFAFILGVIMRDADHITEKYFGPKGDSKFIEKNGKTLKVAFIIGLAASSIFTLSFDGFITPVPVPDSILITVADFLKENGNYRYVTIGFGTSFMKLSYMSSSETIDGGYNSARRLPILTNSGIERVDNVKYFPNSEVFLENLLNKSAELGIKWVIQAGPIEYSFESILKKYMNRYEPINEKQNSTTIQYWINKVPVNVTDIQTREDFSLYQIVVWSFGPISSLMTVSALYIGGLIKRYERDKGK